jgi:hypothetical protein
LVEAYQDIGAARALLGTAVRDPALGAEAARHGSQARSTAALMTGPSSLKGFYSVVASAGGLPR